MNEGEERQEYSELIIGQNSQKIKPLKDRSLTSVVYKEGNMSFKRVLVGLGALILFVWGLLILLGSI